MALAEPIPEPTAGCALMLNENMAKLLSKILTSGQRQTGKVQVCLDATYKVGNAHWGLAICSVSNKHVGPECKFAASGAIPIALGWIPKENYACLSSFLITMCETYASKGLHAAGNSFRAGRRSHGYFEGSSSGRYGFFFRLCVRESERLQWAFRRGTRDPTGKTNMQMLGLSDWTCLLLLNRNTWKLLSILMPSCGWDAAILAASSFVGANGFLTQRQRERKREREGEQERERERGRATNTLCFCVCLKLLAFTFTMRPRYVAQSPPRLHNMVYLFHVCNMKLSV